MRCFVCNSKEATALDKKPQWGLCGSKNWCKLETQICPIEPGWLFETNWTTGLMMPEVFPI